MSKACGLLSLTKAEFGATLHQHLEPWLNEHGALPVVMAGMVGSQQGWQEVPYVFTPRFGANVAEKCATHDHAMGQPGMDYSRRKLRQCVRLTRRDAR
ncbi:2-dehydro-3-deoxygalactonokinase [Citrobacter amalonaticus]|nr:2-dehydro-3-deoxygalactonokinase [Citrobacter amalonaticus]